MGEVTRRKFGQVGFARQVALSIPVTIAAAAVDAGNTGYTYILRAGLMLGIITASGKYAQYDDGASDGTQTAKAILLNDLDLKDGDPAASAADHPAEVMVLGSVETDAIIGDDANGIADLAGQIWFL